MEENSTISVRRIAVSLLRDIKTQRKEKANNLGVKETCLAA
jgi:hypothetical protein